MYICLYINRIWYVCMYVYMYLILLESICYLFFLCYFIFFSYFFINHHGFPTFPTFLFFLIYSPQIPFLSLSNIFPSRFSISSLFLPFLSFGILISISFIQFCALLPPISLYHLLLLLTLSVLSILHPFISRRHLTPQNIRLITYLNKNIFIKSPVNPLFTFPFSSVNNSTSCFLFIFIFILLSDSKPHPLHFLSLLSHDAIFFFFLLHNFQSVND